MCLIKWFYDDEYFGRGELLLRNLHFVVVWDIIHEKKWQLGAHYPSAGLKTIGLKLIFKIKYNEKGEVEMHKTKLMAKGYSKHYGINFNEVFAPISRWDTIRTILRVVASKEWCIFELDVKSVFLHIELA